MKISFLVAPKQMPFSMVDPGIWWDFLSTQSDIKLEYFDLNYDWWNSVLSTRIVRNIIRSQSFSNLLKLFVNKRFYKLLISSFYCKNLKKQLREKENYQSIEKYILMVGKLDKHLENINAAQKEFYICPYQGLRIHNFNYGNSEDYYNKTKDTVNVFYHSIEEIINEKKLDMDVLFVNTDEEFDLLTAMIAISIIRKKRPNIYVSLISYSQEYYYIKPSLEKLEENGFLFKCFDSIVLGKEKNNLHAVNIVDQIKNGFFPKGFILNSSIKKEIYWNDIDFNKRERLPQNQFFSCKATIVSRAYENKCYWAKCAFCTQHLKYETLQEVDFIAPEVIGRRLDSFINQGFEIVNIANEALPPKYLSRLCNYLIENQSSIKWGCLLRLDEHYKTLFPLMKKAGCYEVVFGFESACSRILDKMNKYPKEYDKSKIEEIIREAGKQGLGIYTSTIMGFPTETVAEMQETSDFLAVKLRNIKNLSFFLHSFILFYKSAVYENCKDYGIIPIEEEGDLLGRLNYEEENKDSVQLIEYRKQRNQIIDETYRKFGFDSLLERKDGVTALLMYCLTAHGGVFKTNKENIFDNLRF